MGLEFLFSPITILVFALLNVGIVLLQRLLFRSGFEVFGIKRVVVAYLVVLALSLVLGVFLGNGILKDSVSNFLLACYNSLIFVSIGLLPFSLFLAGRGKFSVGAVIVFALALSALIGAAMVLTIGLDKIAERGGATWFLRQAYILGFFVVVSVAFSIGLKIK